MKRYIDGFLRLGTAAALLFVIYNQNKQIKQLETDNKSIQIIKNERDSLKQEIFVKDIEIGSYTHILDLIDTELDPDCKAKVEKLKNQVE
jgi:hypothetical protein